MPLDGGNDRIRLRRDGHNAEFHQVECLESLTTAGKWVGLAVDGPETDGYRIHESGLDGLPCQIDAVFQQARLDDVGNLGFEGNALGGRLRVDHLSDGLGDIVLPEQGDRKLDFHAEGFDDVAHAIRRGSRGNALDDALFLVDAADLKRSQELFCSHELLLRREVVF